MDLSPMALVWQAWVSETDNAQTRECITKYRGCMQAPGLKANSPDKGLINTFLAIRSDEDPRLGPSARDRSFHFNAPGFAPLRDLHGAI